MKMAIFIQFIKPFITKDTCRGFTSFNPNVVSKAIRPPTFSKVPSVVPLPPARGRKWLLIVFYALAANTGYGIWAHNRKYPEDDLLTGVTHSLPLRLFSRVWGIVHRLELPVSWRAPLFNWWSRTFDCNLGEMRYPLEHYRNLAEFFARPLKDGVRPIDLSMELVSPVDAKVTHFGIVESDGTLEQIKGSTYSLRDFIGETPALVNSPDSHRLYFCVLYLAPGDYHRIHSASDWKIQKRLHVPGKVLSVAPSFLSAIPHVFSENERIVLSGLWEHGFYSLTSVAAYNVGSIKLVHDEEVITNRARQHSHTLKPYGSNTEHSYARTYDNPISLRRGEELARFELGSTVVLVFEAPLNFGFDSYPNNKIRMGEKLGSCGLQLPESSRAARKLRKQRDDLLRTTTSPTSSL